MRAFNKTIAIVTASVALSAFPALAFAQRTAGSGGGAGSAGAATAAPRGASSAPSSGGASSGASNTSSSSSSSSAPPTPVYSQPSPSVSAAPMRMAAPERRMAVSYAESGAQQRSAPASAPRASAPSNSAGHATPRAASNPNARAGSAGVVTARANPRTTAPASNNVNGTAEVPSWSRNRGNHSQTGTAIARSPNNPAPGTAAYYAYYANQYGYYNPYYYDPYGFYGYYGIGGGYYGFYNPYYAPYGFGGFGFDSGFGVPYYSDPNDPYMYGTGFGDYSSRVYGGEGEGALKLKVKPRDAKVYVDGYYVGNVDQFDGMFQKLSLNGGSHHVEIKAEGYETSEFDVLITPKQTLTFSGDLKKLQ